MPKYLANNTALVFLILLILFLGCKNKRTIPKDKEDTFYTVTGGWDWISVPLIKPYKVFKTDPELKTNPWTVHFFTTLGTYNVKRVDVKDSIVYILSGKIDEGNDSTLVDLRNVPTGWYVINANQKTEQGFGSEREFLAYIKTKNFQAPQWHNIDSLSKSLGNGGTVPWIPKK